MMKGAFTDVHLSVEMKKERYQNLSDLIDFLFTNITNCFVIDF